MTLPIGATVRLYYDSPRRVGPDDYLVTPGGRCYLVLAARVQTRGKHAGRRQRLTCLVQREPDLEQAILPLYWYRRRRRAR